MLDPRTMEKNEAGEIGRSQILRFLVILPSSLDVGCHTVSVYIDGVTCSTKGNFPKN